GSANFEPPCVENESFPIHLMHELEVFCEMTFFDFKLPIFCTAFRATQLNTCVIVMGTLILGTPLSAGL
ncbi:MAG: hypothetical protein NTZ32_01225, partial [Planctomycetales bacterium]|nr:hypothetical protein [Planctomycetales bacterium]